MREPSQPSRAPASYVDMKAPAPRGLQAKGGLLWVMIFCVLMVVLLLQGDLGWGVGWLLLVPVAILALFGLWLAWMLVVRRGVLTWMRLAWAPRKAVARGDIAEAERACTRALARANRFSPQDHRRGLMLVELAGFVKGQGRYKEAKTLFEESVAILAHRWQSAPLDYFIALNNHAVYYIDLGDYTSAQRILEQVLDLTLFWKKRRQAKRPGAAQWAPMLELVLHHNLVVLFVQMDELAEAAAHMEELDRIFPKLSRRQEARLGDQYHGTRALLMHALGRYADAVAELKQASNANEPVCLHVRAKLALVQMEFAEAEQLLRQGLELEKKKGSLHRPNLRDYSLDLAESLFGQGKHQEAFAALQEARTLVADFAMPAGPLWRRALVRWLQRARELSYADLAALLEADLQQADAVEQAITISPRLRLRPAVP